MINTEKQRSVETQNKTKDWKKWGSPIYASANGALFSRTMVMMGKPGIW